MYVAKAHHKRGARVEGQVLLIAVVRVDDRAEEGLVKRKGTIGVVQVELMVRAFVVIELRLQKLEGPRLGGHIA